MSINVLKSPRGFAGAKLRTGASGMAVGIWMGLLAGSLVLGGIRAEAATQPYAYPSSLPQKSVKPEIHTGMQHASSISTGYIPEKYLKNPHESPLSILEWHFRGKDGTDIAGHGGAMNCKHKEVELNKGLSIPGAEVGDVFLFYLQYNDPNGPWVSKEFAVRCGGSGAHKDCNRCYKLIPLSVAQEELRRQAAPMAQRVDVRGLAEQRRQGVPTVKVQDLLGGDDVLGHDVQLRAEITIYSLDALPKEEPIGRLKAGMTVHAGEEVAPTLVRAKFTTSSGREYEGAVKFSDLVSQTELDVHLALHGTGTIGESAESRHRNELYIPSVPETFLAGSSMAHNAAMLRLLKSDGSSQEIKTRIGASIGMGPVSHSLSASLKLDGANPRDEYLCYLLHNTNGVTQVSQPFGLLCGEGGPHGRCADCYDLLPPEKVQTMLERAVALKKSNLRAGGIEDESDHAALTLARDTAIYSLKALPREQVMGTLKAGTRVYMMEQVGGEYVRVRFTTPGGRNLEGAARTTDFGMGKP